MVGGRKKGAIVGVVVAIAASAFVVTRERPRPDNPPPARPAASAPQPAVAALLALPEVKAMSEQIEKSSMGAAHGAIIGGDAEPKVVDGKTYQSYSFMESDPKISRRIQGFYVTADGKDILVDDIETGDAIPLEEWRKAQIK
jgi:hypothetical protein